MNKGFLVNYVYVMMLVIILNILANFKFTLISLAFVFICTLLYTRVLFIFKYKNRVVIQSIVVTLLFVITVANVLNIIVKGQIITLSQVKLITELFAVKDTVFGYINFFSLISILIPIIMIIVSKDLLKGDVIRVYKKEVLILISLFLGVNVFAFMNDRFLYATVYNPTEYVEEYGIFSYYTREMLPFTKIKMTDSDISKNVNDNDSNDSSLGTFEDKKNVVFIKTESFDYAAIDEELTPTLFKMVENGMVFENYYTLSNNTNASEFSTLTSVPPPIDNAKINNFDSEYDTIPKLFEQKGFCTFGVHGNTKSFYDRESLYPNLYGFQNSYFAEDLNMSLENGWVRDTITFDSVIPLIEEQSCENNFTYYMSVFGHSGYKLKSNSNISNEYTFVDSVYPQYDEYYKVYLSKHIDLDNMLANMENYYSNNGEIDNTVFIIVSDHYPYALGDTSHSYGEYSNSYVEKSFDGSSFEEFNIPFIIYDPSTKMEDRSEYVSNIDILPTLADLFGLKYEYTYGSSALSNSHRNRVEWLAYKDFGIIGEDIVYTKEDGVLNGEEDEVNSLVEESKIYSAYIYGLFE